MKPFIVLKDSAFFTDMIFPHLKEYLIALPVLFNI